MLRACSHPCISSVGLLAVLLTSTASAQLISPKTVPIKQGEQFGIYPSQLPGLGALSIAVDDTIGDPWANPAKGARLTSGSLHVMPFFHSATQGGGRTLAVSMLQTKGAFAGGVVYSTQELERTGGFWNAPISERRAANQYLAGMLAWRLGGGLSVGGGLSLAELRGVDGVGALYDGNDRVRQSGGFLDSRLGVTKDFSTGSTLELVGVHYRYNMSHDVHFPSRQVWAPCDCPPVGPCNCTPDTTPERSEHHEDRTNITGLHAVFVAPRTPDGWRLGYLFTANRLSHPKLPDYQLPTVESIPRDPGNTTALNAGFGAARTMGRSTFGIDVIKEPMWSHTWADAARDTMDVSGAVIPRGAHTVDNHFRFSNSRISVGVSQQVHNPSDSGSIVTFQFGLSMRSINYTLDQSNHVSKTSRTQDEGWTEWTPTFAIEIRGHDMTFTYAMRRTCGPQCSGPVFFSGGDDATFAAPSDPTVLAPPDSPLTFTGGSSGQHRFMLSIRMR